MGLQDLKKRFAPTVASRIYKETPKAADLDAEAPSPVIPIDRRRNTLQARGEKQRQNEMPYEDQDQYSHHIAHARPPTSLPKESIAMPTSPRSRDDAGSAAGEPLFQNDFPMHPVPNEFRPYNRRRHSGSASVPQDTQPRESQKRSVRMDLDYHQNDDDESVQLRRSKAQTPVIIAPPPRQGTPASHRVRRNSQPSTPKAIESGPRLEEPPHQDRPESDNLSSPNTSRFSGSKHSNPSVLSVETKASSVESASGGLPALQAKSALPDGEQLEPVLEDDPASFDLVLPIQGTAKQFQLEDRSDQIFSRSHLEEIFKDTALLLQFTNFLSARRPKSVPLLVYYLDALKALRAIDYANAVAEALTPLDDHDFSTHMANPTLNSVLEEKARTSFDAMVKDDLPAFITHTWIRVVSLSISRRITGTLPPHLREASEGLAEVFCLTDPNRQDNPIIFASEEFHRTTQYGMNYAIGRNCRFLQGPRTNKHSVDRLAKAVKEEREVSEVFLNYRRDGSPFMNLLMCAPLLDSRGKTRYFIGAQVDVSGLCKEGTDLPGLQRLIAKQKEEAERQNAIDEEQLDAYAADQAEHEEKDTFQELAEMFNETELNTVRKYGGKMHREQIDEESDGRRGDRPRLLIKEPSDPSTSPQRTMSSLSVRNGRLEGIYQNYLLVRPYPSLRILFCSPSLRVPGILQSPFLDRIGGSTRVRDTLVAALADGRGVTAKVRWIAGRSGDEEGRPRWIHCTPLLGQNGAVGVWMIVLIEDEAATPQRKFRQPPPVDAHVRAKKSERDLFDPPELPDVLRPKMHDGEYVQRDARRPTTGCSAGNESLESFTIAPA